MLILTLLELENLLDILVSEDKQMTTKVFKECFAEGYEGPNDVKFDFS